MEKEVYVKIFLRRNKYVVKFKSSHLKGEMVCRTIVELDNKMNKIIKTFPNLSFNIKFSQGALGRYTWEIDSPILLFKMGFKFMGHLGETNSRVFFNDESYELVIIDEDGWLKKYKLN